MSQELEQIGVRGVDAGAIEAEVLAQAQAAGAAPAPEPSGQDPPALQQQLHAVQRELRTVAAAVEGYQQQQQQQQQPDAAEVQEQPGGGTSKSRPSPAATPASSLQQAVMQQRLTDLQARKQQLEQSLAEVGVAPAADTEAPSAGAQPAGQPPGPPQRSAGPALPSRGAGSSKGSRGRQKAQLDLAEADVFEGVDAAAGGGGGAAGGLVETERDRLIRLGILTPFDRLDGFERRIQRGPRAREGGRQQPAAASTTAAAPVHDSIRRVGEAVRAARAARPTSILMDPADLPRPNRPTRRIDEGFWRQSASGRITPAKKKRRRTLAPAKRPRLKRRRGGGLDGAEGEEEEEEEEEVYGASDVSSASGGSEAGAGDAAPGSGEDLGGEFDDANEEVYEERRAAFLRRRGKQATRTAQRRLRKARASGGPAALEAGEGGGSLEDSDASGRSGGEDAAVNDDEEEEEEDVVFEGGYRLPADLYDRLFDYQRTAVKWMWELHTQRAGGIIGDEMGLGKTIQVIAFLAGLHHSGLFRPSLIVCPATVLRQWLRELRAWWPLFRVALLHDSARSGAGGARPSRQRLIREIAQSDSGVLLTTYETMRLQRGDLLGVEWGYVVLDEGHKIRNPDAEVTLAAKQVQTVHRLIMSGSPIQNRLTELWSLFDFVFPGKLGTLPVFTAQFALPIQIGGYANASPLQVSTAYRCAVILRDLIAPYLLRRRKADVRAQLPRKTEQVLFCGLTVEQRDLYRGYLGSKELREIFSGSRTALAGIDVLRKICNHPDLLERAKWEAAEDYGNPERSGKLQVLAKVLRHWKEQGHKALVFTQTQQMLDILEKHVEAQGYAYHRMDGSTSVAQRARLIDDFNNNPGVFCFLLTTRVGGLGVNLTGANRVVLYDPDWNPSTDVQARERAWRIGQAREVVVYRLITSGTIEEKVYHRQVYKHFLTDKVLRDPRQRRFFRAKDLTDLFTLGDEYADGTETASLFASLGTEVMPEAEEGEQPRQGAASDQDDYGGDEGQGGGAQQRRHSSSPAPGGSASLPAGVRAEAAANGGEAVGGEGGEQKGDAGMLRELFEGSDVRGAIDHGKVEGANDPQRRAADQEARRIARRAAEALRQSRLQCQTAPVSQPTWTGRSGAAGVPGAQPRFGRAANPRLQAAAQQQQAGGAGSAGTGGRRFGSGGAAGPRGSAGLQAGSDMGAAPRSNEILARLRERQAAVAGAAAASAAADPEVERAQALAARISSFLQARGGAAASDELVSHFQASVGAAQMPLFRGVLKQVAALQRRTPAEGGGKEWVLRPEFAGDGGTP